MELPQSSCPQGYTEDDLSKIFGDKLPSFTQWMTGQTMGICDGRRFEHKREHNDNCMNPTASFMRFHPDYKPHTQDSAFDWTCGYVAGGSYEPTACFSSPHGVVTYRVDVEAFTRGMPPLD